MKQRYWNMLTQFKFEIFYLDEHFRFCVNLDRALKIILAVLSASSVAGWTIWEKYATLWAVIIAVSQVLIIINEFLPYKSRISQISKIQSTLPKIYEKAENLWRDVYQGELNDDQINDLVLKFRQQWEQSQGKCFQDDALPEIKFMIKHAKDKTKRYFSLAFGGDNNETN